MTLITSKAQHEVDGRHRQYTDMRVLSKVLTLYPWRVCGSGCDDVSGASWVFYGLREQEVLGMGLHHHHSGCCHSVAVI